MPEKGSRITAAQIRAQQAARERLAEARREEAARKAEEERKHALEEEDRAFAREIASKWNAMTVDAAEREGVRFCVLARVTTDTPGQLPTVLHDVCEAAKADGFCVGLLSELATTPPINLGRKSPSPRNVSFTSARPPSEACEVFDGTVKGWYPGTVPVYARGGSNPDWLVVRWD